MEKMPVTGIFYFSHNFFKSLFYQSRKNQGLFGKGLIDLVCGVAPLRDCFRVIVSELHVVPYEILHYSSTFVARFHAAGRACRYIIHICFHFGQGRTTYMCFYCILKALLCIGEERKTWGHDREQAILSGQFWCRLVFSEKRNRLTC